MNIVYYIGCSLRGTTVSVATYPLTMRSIRGGTLGWNIEIYFTPKNQFDWSVSRAYVINNNMDTTIDHFTPLALRVRGNNSCHQKKFVIERTRDQIYLKYVATDFFLKIISPNAGENSGDLA